MMKDGRLVERGSHAELMERAGEYYRLASYDTNLSGPADQHGEHGPTANGASPQHGEQPDIGLRDAALRDTDCWTE